MSVSHKVKLTYFKQTGKYYSDGEYESCKTDLWEIWDEIRQFLAKKELPGLVKGCSEFYIIVNVPTHEHNHPRLIIPTEFDSQD